MPWREPAVLLAVDEHRVEDAAAVVDRDVADRLDPAGLGVDLDDRDVRAERERRARPGRSRAPRERHAVVARGGRDLAPT